MVTTLLFKKKLNKYLNVFDQFVVLAISSICKIYAAGKTEGKLSHSKRLESRESSR